jgi:hypothetical protein
VKNLAYGLVLLLFLACGRSGRVENAYKTADDWTKDKENITWKPAFMPAEAQQIKEIHNQKTHEMIGVYHYRENPLEEGAELKIMTRNGFQLQMRRLSSFRLPRWFISEKEMTRKKEIRVYMSGGWYIVDDFREKRVFFMKISG